MDKSSMLDKALDMFLDDMDHTEGNSAMSHSLDECPDPLNCDMHDSELGSSMAQEEEPGSPAAIEITVHKMGMPSMDGKSAEEEEDTGLGPKELEALKKIIG